MRGEKGNKRRKKGECENDENGGEYGSEERGLRA
jgi:hypothetical protein